jgi:hypothetical protein
MQGRALGYGISCLQSMGKHHQEEVLEHKSFQKAIIAASTSGDREACSVSENEMMWK